MNAILKLIHDWTLPLAIASGTILYMIFAFIPQLDEAANFFGPFFNDFLPFFMFLILFVTFCKVDFRQLGIKPWIVLTVVFQTIFSMALVSLILFFHISGRGLVLMEALLTCTVCPVASAAAVVTRKLGGKLEEMTALTFVSNFATSILIPICFPLIDSAIDISFIDSFLKILYEVCLVLLLPMVFAYVVKHYTPKLHHKIVSINDLSYYLWGMSLMIVSGTTVKNIFNAHAEVSFLLAIALMSLIICVGQFAVGRFIGHFFNRSLEAGQGLGQKNTAFAIWTANAYLTPLSTLGPGCYILWQNIINSLEIWIYRKKGKEQAA